MFAKKARARSDHSLAIQTDGSLWAWGWFGGFVLGDTTGRSTPTRVGTGTTWTAISGGQHTLALKVDGSLWAWGCNGSGQLGLGDAIPRYTPTQVGTGTDWTAICSGLFHSVGIIRYVPPPPAVTAVTPTSGYNDQPFTITGINLIGAITVKLGSTSLTTFTVDSGTQITATVPAGLALGTYTVYVSTPGGVNATGPSFQVR